jgi:trimeric autotransporter adhesin
MISTVPTIVVLTPLFCMLQPSPTQLFIATVSSTSHTPVRWSVSPSVGSVSAAGWYTAPPTMTSRQRVTLTATSVADASKTATEDMTLNPPLAVSLSPATVTLYAGQTQQFNATVSNISNTTVLWLGQRCRLVHGSAHDDEHTDSDADERRRFR